MLVYRVVPNRFITMIDSERVWYLDTLTSEDVFYDLGYMNFSDAHSYFPLHSSDPVVGGRLNTFKDINEKTKAFFLFPWDAIRNIRFFKRRYSREVASILEYDISDEILSEYLGFGYYNGEEIPEFRIPYRILKGEENLLEEINDEFRKVLIDKYRTEIKNSVDLFLPVFSKRISNINGFKKYVDDIINPLNTELLLKEMGSVFDYLGTSFLSDAITGKRILVTWNDVLGITYSTRNFDVQSFVDKSNGMLTMDSFEDWEDYISKDSRFEKREILCKKYF